jgi:hypothetical protein
VYIHDSARKPGVANKFREFWFPEHKVSRKLSDWAYKVISMSGREFVVNVNGKKPCLNPESLQPRAPLKRTAQQYRVVCSKKPTVTIRSRLIPTTADETRVRQLKLQYTSPHSSQELREVETPSLPVDVFGDTTWTPHPNLVRVTTTSDMPIT